MLSFYNSDQGQTNFLSTCPCETHLTKTFADRKFAFDVHTLYNWIFGDNPFSRAYHGSQKLMGKYKALRRYDVNHILL